MSTLRITSVSHWFYCVRPAATPAERHAALAALACMLAGDSTRPRHISLPGRPAPSPPPPPPAPDLHPSNYARPRSLAQKTIEPDDDDALDPYSREELEHMNARFAQRLRRAIARGQESALSCLGT